MAVAGRPDELLAVADALQVASDRLGEHREVVGARVGVVLGPWSGAPAGLAREWVDAELAGVLRAADTCQVLVPALRIYAEDLWRARADFGDGERLALDVRARGAPIGPGPLPGADAARNLAMEDAELGANVMLGGEDRAAGASETAARAFERASWALDGVAPPPAPVQAEGNFGARRRRRRRDDDRIRARRALVRGERSGRRHCRFRDSRAVRGLRAQAPTGTRHGMTDVAPEAGDGPSSQARSLAARDAAGVMLGLATLLRRRSFDPATVDQNLVETTIRRLRRVGTELLPSDDEQADDDPPAPPDGVAWATQLCWLLSHSTQDEQRVDGGRADGNDEAASTSVRAGRE